MVRRNFLYRRNQGTERRGFESKNRYEAELDQLKKLMKKGRIIEKRTEYQPESEKDEPLIDIQRGYSIVSRLR